MYKCNMILDSVSESGKRIISLEAVYPMIVHNEIMTHRVFSRGSASSRAIPVSKMIASVVDNPFIPDRWYRNAKGMQPGEEITSQKEINVCIAEWLGARDDMVKRTQRLAFDNDVAKEIANRLLAPFLWNTIIITSTHWCNFLNLRCHPMAQRQVMIIADMIRDQIMASTPQLVKTDGIHAPYISDIDYEEVEDIYKHVYVDGKIVQISTGRCARVSYKNQDGIRAIEDDVKLHDRLIAQVPRHAGPLEHCAYALKNPYQWSGNFMGWQQYRKEIPHENLTEYTHNSITISDLPMQKEPTE